ncbi:Protein SFK1 [Cyphellophora attinorum]|uniref:Protein SFK1 n=1 Tax=Cyphellophora attinorum TaxID=1664694 RepID=A0A0N1HYM5_9EURO|nr:Protein SFK1 [Phialophora attinorum]KPI45972.1 Protein SFK1 [Phialophora attinorum]
MWGYVAILPMIAALDWVGMLLGMLLWWVCNGAPILPAMHEDPNAHPGAQRQTIAYISDIGATELKPLFISMSSVMAVTLNLSFLAERWLRHNGKLAPNTSRVQKALSITSIFFAMAGGAGIILLSIFDTYHHPTLHDVFLGVFIIGYVISAICLCAEYQRLGIHYRHHRILAISFWIKLFFILIEIALAICFISFSAKYMYNEAAVFEWIVSFVFTLYALSFVLDLLPAVQTSRHVPQGVKEREGQLEAQMQDRPSRISRFVSFTR